MPGQPQLICPIDPAIALGIDAYELVVTDPSGTPSSLIIDAGSNFDLSVNFRVGGVAKAAFKAAGDDIEVNYFYEGYGATATEGIFNATPVIVTSDKGKDSTTCAGALEYGDDTGFTVAAGTLPPGLYKLSAVVSPDSTWGMFAFVEGPVIRQV